MSDIRCFRLVDGIIELDEYGLVGTITREYDDDGMCAVTVACWACLAVQTFSRKEYQTDLRLVRAAKRYARTHHADDTHGGKL